MRALWTFNESIWEHRNEKLHSGKAESQQIRESIVDAKVKSFYDSQQDFAVANQVIFHRPINTLLTMPPRKETMVSPC